MNIEQDVEYNLTKLHMLQALARSQAAIASILEQTALVTNEYQLPASLIREQLRSLANYQGAMIAQLSGVQMKRAIRSTTIQRPWLNMKLISK